MFVGIELFGGQFAAGQVAHARFQRHGPLVRAHRGPPLFDVFNLFHGHGQDLTNPFLRDTQFLGPRNHAVPVVSAIRGAVFGVGFRGKLEEVNVIADAHLNGRYGLGAFEFENCLAVPTVDDAPLVVDQNTRKLGAGPVGLAIGGNGGVVQTDAWVQAKVFNQLCDRDVNFDPFLSQVDHLRHST